MLNMKEVRILAKAEPLLTFLAGEKVPFLFFCVPDDAGTIFIEGADKSGESISDAIKKIAQKRGLYEKKT